MRNFNSYFANEETEMQRRPGKLPKVTEMVFDWLRT